MLEIEISPQLQINYIYQPPEEEDIVRQSNELNPLPQLPQAQPTQNKIIPEQTSRRRRKRTRMRQLQQKEAHTFMKQPVLKINNLNKNLKRAYEKGFFDDSKFDFIRSLRKIRRHPEQDSVSSHYGSDQSFDINDVLPKRGFQRKKIINQDGGLLSSSDSQAPKQKKISKQRKPRQPRQPRLSKPRLPRKSGQFKQLKQLRTKKQTNSQKQIKKQSKFQELRSEQQKKDYPKKSGVQIRYTKAPAQMPKKTQKQDNSEESLNQSQSQFKSSVASRSQQKIIAQNIRESEKVEPQQKTQNKNNDKHKQRLTQVVNQNIQQVDKLKISVQQAQKLLSQPQKVQIVNLNHQLPSPLNSKKYIPPNIAIRKNQQPEKISIKKLLPQHSQNESSDSQSQASSSSQSSSSSGSSSSDQQGQSKLIKEKKKNKHKSQSSSSQNSQKKKKKKKKQKHRQNQSESILTKLIKDDNFRKILVKQKQKEALKKVKNFQKKERKSDEEKQQVKDQPKKVYQQKIQFKDTINQKSNKNTVIEATSSIQKLKRISQSVQNNEQSKNQFANKKKEVRQINAQKKIKQKSDKLSTLTIQPAITKEQKIFKSILQNQQSGIDKIDSRKMTTYNKATQNTKKLQIVQQVKPGFPVKSLKQKSKKLKNLSMENNVVVLKLNAGKDQPSLLNDKNNQDSYFEHKSKDGKQQKNNRILSVQQIKIKNRVRQSQTQESSDSSQERYYSHKRKYKHIPRKVVRYRKVIVQRSQSSDSHSSDSYQKKRVIRRVKRQHYDSQSSESKQQAADYRIANVESRKGQKIRHAIKKRR